MIRLRPRLAPGICVAIWALCAFLVGDAVVRIGLRALPYTLPVLLLAAFTWAMLWHPQVIIDEARRRVTVRNVLTTWHVPAAALLDTRVGAMVTLVVRAVDGAERTVTAWNAPGISPLQRAPRLSPGQRSGLDTVMDPVARSGSAVLVDAWRRWGGADAEAARAGADAEQAARAGADAEQAARRTWNVLPIALVVGLAAASVVSVVMILP